MDDTYKSTVVFLTMEFQYKCNIKFSMVNYNSYCIHYSMSVIFSLLIFAY